MNSQTLVVGTVLEVDRLLYRHCGLVHGFSNGEPVVLANLPGGVRLHVTGGANPQISGDEKRRSAWL